MHNLPKWLPKSVAVHCTNKLNSGALSEDQQKTLLRLATHQNMRSVWETLEKIIFKSENSDPSKLVNLIEDVRLHPLILYPTAEIKKLSAVNRRKYLKKISDSSQNLLAALTQFDPASQDANRGIAFLQSELSRIQNQAASLGDDLKVVKLHEFLELLVKVENYGIVDTLETLNASAKIAIDTPPYGSRKQGALTASRTLFIKELKRYIQFNFSKKLNQVVATIVNTAMNLPPETVTEDMVRKA